jgi:hypothetical protein
MHWLLMPLLHSFRLTWESLFLRSEPICRTEYFFSFRDVYSVRASAGNQCMHMSCQVPLFCNRQREEESLFLTSSAQREISMAYLVFLSYGFFSFSTSRAAWVYQLSLKRKVLDSETESFHFSVLANLHRVANRKSLKLIASTVFFYVVEFTSK